jgi:hypothetical protein
LSRSRELLQIEDLRGEVFDTLIELSGSSEIDNRKIISTVEDILGYDIEGMPKEVEAQLIALRDQLVGVSFHSRLQRYAGMDLLQDQMDRHGNEIKRTENHIRKLAEEALTAPDILDSELGWLVTREAKNGYRFGYTLGQIDEERRTWQNIREAYFSAGDEADEHFVGGYLRAVFERNPTVWEAIIASIVVEGSKLAALPGLVWRSGMTNETAEVILQLLRSGKISPETLGIFGMGRGTDLLSDAMLAEWLDALIAVGSFPAASTALDLASMAIHGGRVLAAAQIEHILTQPALAARKEGRGNSMLSHHWLQLARALIKSNPEAESIVLASLLNSIGESGAITDGLGPEGNKYLDELVLKHPTETWRIVSQSVKPPMDVRGFIFTRWLRGDMGFSGRNPGPMRHIPREEIWSWIDVDPEPRASYVANMAPKDFTVDDWNDSLIRGILCRFGDSEKVQNSVFANFFTGAWSGPASSHYDEQKSVLRQLKSNEENPHALRWLNTAIDSTEKSLEAARIEEEARGY